MIIIKSDFTNQYIDALNIIYCEQPKIWEYFCKNIPPFSKVNNYDSLVETAKKVHLDNYVNVNDSKKKYIEWLKNDKNQIETKLYSIFNTKVDKIYAYVCLTPLFTRNIYDKSFLLPTNANKKRFYNIVVHELIHFFYYQKVEELVFLIDEDILWKVSELIVPTIIKLCFSKYYISNKTYDFTLEEEKKAFKVTKLFIDKKISFEQLLRRLIND